MRNREYFAMRPAPIMKLLPGVRADPSDLFTLRLTELTTMSKYDRIVNYQPRVRQKYERIGPASQRQPGSTGNSQSSRSAETRYPSGLDPCDS
jgi:hypothetical protein